MHLKHYATEQNRSLMQASMCVNIEIDTTVSIVHRERYPSLKAFYMCFPLFSSP